MKLKKIRDALLVMLTLALVSATAVAVTWAFVVKDKLNSLENTFTTPEVSAKLAEDRWDGRSFGDETDSVQIPVEGSDPHKYRLPYSYDSEDNTTYGLSTAGKFGKTIAQSYTTGTVIPKNPGIKNTTTQDVDEWVAMTVDYRLKVYDNNNTTDNATDNKYLNYVADGNSTTLYVGTKTVNTTTYYLKEGGDATATVEEGANWISNEANAWKITVESGKLYKRATAAPTGLTLTPNTGDVNYYYSFTSRADFESALAKLHPNGDGTGSVIDYADYNTIVAAAESPTAGAWVSKNDGLDKTFYYTKKLVVNDGDDVVDKASATDVNITAPLFQSVVINNSFTTTEDVYFTDRDEYGKLLDTNKHTLYAITVDTVSVATEGNRHTLYFDGLPEFDIVLKGYAVQGDEVAWKNASDVYEAVNALNTLIG